MTSGAQGGHRGASRLPLFFLPSSGVPDVDDVDGSPNHIRLSPTARVHIKRAVGLFFLLLFTRHSECSGGEPFFD